MIAWRKALQLLAIRDARFEATYRRLARPGGYEWAEMLRRRGDFYAMGDHCYIDPGAILEDRPLIRLGSNVRIAWCAIMGHDGAVNMINRAYGLWLDSVGKIDIRDNVYIGYGVVVLPGVTIGPNAIVSAGSVVRSSVGEGDIVSGVPARRVGRLEMSVEMLKAKNARFPWRPLIEQRRADFDPTLEQELMRLRAAYYYGEKPAADA